MLKLALLFGGKVLNTYTTDKKEVTIGRKSKNDIHIENLAVSGSHARICRTANGYELHDLDSTNGTFVDGRKISNIALNTSQRVIIGKHQLSIIQIGGTNGSDDFIQTVKVDIKDP